MEIDIIDLFYINKYPKCSISTVEIKQGRAQNIFFEGCEIDLS